jgi:tetratricopeptide (TPR) repeat protein
MRTPTMLALWLSALLAVTGAAADPAASASAEPGASAGKAPPLPLPEIPPLEPLDRKAPSPEAVQGLEGRLDQLASTVVDDPLAGADLRFLTADLDAAAVAAVRQRIEELRNELDGAAASRLLDKARDTGQDAVKAWKKKNKGAKDAPEGDWLVFILSLEDRGETWRDLADLYAMLRMLESLASGPAVREMVNCYSYFGELVRIDLQRSIERLGDKAVAALIEARKHDARKVRSWANRQLDVLGKVTPGEAVSTTEPEILADVLRAFGRVRDVDAARVILSFVASDRAELRRAAREAIGALGEAAEWHLRDSYESQTGERPPKSWDHEQLARELFRMHDRARLAKVYLLVEQGHAALGDKRYAEAAQAFDKVLAHSPLFEGRAEMAPAYLGYAEELIAADEVDDAAVTLRKALRLAPDSPSKNEIESRLLFLEGRALADKGTPDVFVLKRALELDPDNAQAKALLDSLAAEAATRRASTEHYISAALVALLALAALIVLYRRRDRKAPPPDARATDAETSA